MNPKLIVEQKITAFTNKYMIYSVNTDGSKSDLLALAQQKRLAFREKVTFYKDDTKIMPLFSFRAEKVMDVHGRYFVENEKGDVIGAFKKEFGKSLLNSTWNILDETGQPKLQINESNQVLAIVRRFGGFIPILGGFVEIITALLRYHFDLTNLKSNTIVGRYQKTKLFRDHYVLSATDESYNQNDWRVLACVAVALDALQSR